MNRQITPEVHQLASHYFCVLSSVLSPREKVFTVSLVLACLVIETMSGSNRVHVAHLRPTFCTGPGFLS